MNWDDLKNDSTSKFNYSEVRKLNGEILNSVCLVGNGWLKLKNGKNFCEWELILTYFNQV